MLSTSSSLAGQRFLSMYRKAFLALEQAIRDNALFRHEDVIWHCYDALEFWWKAIYWLLVQQEPAFFHMPRSQDWKQIATRLSDFADNHKISKADKIYKKWGEELASARGGPRLRLNARYGPLDAAEAGKSSDLLQDTEWVAILAAELRRAWLFRVDPAIGVLTRFYDEHLTREAPPNRGSAGFYPHANLKLAKVRGWRRELSNRAHGWRVAMAAASTMRREFLIVINPYGESYPEHPSGGGYPGYTEVKSYVFSGGLLVLAGGHPFHYYRDVLSGGRPDTSLLIWAVPTTTTGGTKRDHESEGRLPIIVDSWFDKDFGVEFLWDNQFPQPAEAKILSANDGQYITKAELFRPIRASDEGFVRPLAKAYLGRHEVWPVALIRYGVGTIVHFGVDIEAANENEFTFVLAGVERWILKSYEECFHGPPRFSILESAK